MLVILAELVKVLKLKVNLADIEDPRGDSIPPQKKSMKETTMDWIRLEGLSRAGLG